MSAKNVDSLADAGYPQGDVAAMKQAGDRVAIAIERFGAL